MRTWIVVCIVFCGFSLRAQPKDIHLVFTSDVHFGLKKAHFRGAPDSVTSEEVNRAMAGSIRALGKIDYIIITGDIANREEPPVQADAISWNQFLQVYQPLHIPLLLLPGNHDVSNAIGYYRTLYPKRDATSLTGIYNLMIHPVKPLDTAHFDYAIDKVNYTRDIGGIHFMFINIWPDSVNQAWMAKDLQNIKPGMPVLVFAHDPPEGDPKHFTDPDGKGFDQQNKYEDLLPERFNAQYEPGWNNFLKLHPNIKGYFHGHSNYQEFYTYKGVDGILSLPCFRADSPMKGKYSALDERKLSFQVITIHAATRQVEVKECLWNTGAKIAWGESRILQL